MTGQIQVRSPWSQLGIFLGLLGAAFLLSSIAMFAILVSRGITTGTPDFANPEMLSTLKWIQAISSVTIFLLPAWFYSRITFTGNYWWHLGLRPAEKSLMYPIAIAVILFAFPSVFWLGEFNQSINLPAWMENLEKDATAQMEAFLKVNNTLDIFINIFIIALLPAICEELCFRGALQRIMIQICRSPWMGIITASIIFSALHFQFQGFLPRMFLGVVLGALYWYSGSLWPSIIAHFVNNAVQVVAVSFAPEYIRENPGLPLYMAAISGFLVLAILWYLSRISTARYSKLYGRSDLPEF